MRGHEASAMYKARRQKLEKAVRQASDEQLGPTGAYPPTDDTIKGKNDQSTHYQGSGNPYGQQQHPHPQSPGYYHDAPTQYQSPQIQYAAYSHDALPSPAGTPNLDSVGLLHPRRDAPYSRSESFSSQNTYVASAQSSPLIKPAPYHDNPASEQLGKSGSGLGLYDATPVYAARPRSNRRKVWFAIIALVIVAAAVALCVYFFAVKPNKDGDSPADGSAGKGNSTKSPHTKKLVVGRDGDEVKMDDGTTFVYKNKFGGYFIEDPNDPFNNGARAQEWSPALNETWDYGKNIIRGVNLGGWLVLEPFIVPALYEKYMGDDQPVKLDSSEWTLTQAMRADQGPDGGIKQLENHYKTFITEKDFADIAGAGLSWVRLPIPYWTIEVWDGEPFLEHTAWQYCLKAFQWARKYGIRINLDLHTMPGSQNGWNHSGKTGAINWMSGVMGVANAQRSLDYMRIITEFISQPQYKDVVPIFGIVNEPYLDKPYLEQFYMHAYNTIRGVTGTGAGNGPIIAIHDRFMSAKWQGFLKGADRLALDVHNYFAFDGNDKPSIDAFLDRPCLQWGNAINASLMNFGMTTGGEFSLGYNDCGMFVNGGLHDVQHTTNCAELWDNWEAYTPETKDKLRLFALSSMDAMRNFFFWTWKIGPSLRTGKVQAPLWSYSLGLANGWIPEDPREAIGHCAARGVQLDPALAFDGTLAASATGGPGAPSTVDPAATATVRPWPPTQLDQVEGDNVQFPMYTATGVIHTLPPPTMTPPPTKSLNGWAFPQDTALAAVPTAGCTYPDAWNDPTAPIPPPCS